MARYLRFSRPLAMLAIGVAAACLAADVLLLSQAGNEPYVEPFAFELRDNRTFVGVRVIAVGDDLVVRIPRPAFVAQGSYTSNGTCILAIPDAVLYALEPADTWRLLRGEPLAAPLLVEPAAAARQAYCSRDHGLPGFVEVRLDGKAAQIDWLPDLSRPGRALPPWGLDVILAFPNTTSAGEPTLSFLTAQAAADGWAEAAQREGGILGEGDLRADQALRAGAATGVVVFLAAAPGLFLTAPAASPSPTEAALRLRDAGEAHLRRLRTAWLQVGGLLLASLAFSFAWALQTAADLSDGSRPVPAWHFWAIGGILAVAACLVVAWAAGLRQRQRDLRAWRQAFSDHPAESLDDL